jgi:hypothetical protein
MPNDDPRRRTEGRTMPLYLSRFSYTPETWARLIVNPEDRGKAAQSYIDETMDALRKAEQVPYRAPGA